MKYEDDLFIIYYNECDKRYLENLVSILKIRTKRILEFFKLSNMEKVTIKLYDKKDKYKTQLENSFRKAGMDRRYQDWMIADTEDGNINMLSMDRVLEVPGFEGYSEVEYCLNACHEFVHICQQRLHSINPGWFWEVLATYLGNPECNKETEETFTLEDLNTRFDDMDGYGAAFKIAKYMFNHYDNDFLLSLVKDTGKLDRVMDSVMEEIPKNKMGL